MNARPRKPASPAEWGERANLALQADCKHGLMEPDSLGNQRPCSAWNCWGCTRDVVAKIVRSVRRGL